MSSEVAERSSAGHDQAGLYIHVPFCSAICPYCDFAVTTGDSAARGRFVDYLMQEIELVADCPLTFDTVYFGGGTPSALPPRDLQRILAALQSRLTIATDAWVSLEANPEDVDPGTAKAWRDLGVGTVSLGVQSFRQSELRLLVRRHDAAEAERAVECVLERDFPIVSVDLIYGLPDQELRDWDENLDVVVRLRPQHISCYQLTIHGETPFGRQRDSGRLSELSDDAQGGFFTRTHERLAAAGFEPYEISNFAFEPHHRSRHNRKYWSHAPYLGLGPSAHSFHQARRWWNERDVRDYAARLERRERPIAGSEQLGPREIALETLMLGLRTAEGVDLGDVRERLGIDVKSLNEEKIRRYVQSGLATWNGSRLALTTAGLAIADGIARDLEVE